MRILAPMYKDGYPCAAGGCISCEHLIRLSENAYCGFVPKLHELHECIKGIAYAESEDPWRRCTMCRHYDRNLNDEQCNECLGTSSLIHYQVDITLIPG